MSIELDETANDPEAASKPTALAPGAQLGKYKLERVLGQGGMGVVWSARDPDLQRSIAIKVLKGAHAGPKLRQRLLREAVAMAKLKHPNVLTVYEVGTVGDRDYIAMELVEGTTLDHWLAARPPQEEVWAAILAAGRGLAAAHDAGVVHRDFKPHNVMRSRDGRILVTDFGLARGVIGEDEDGDGTELPAPDSVLDTPLTHTGALIGTPAYMAPEQFDGATPDPRTDQFAFCVTAWQAFTGERPFLGATLDEMKKLVSAGVSSIALGPPRAIRTVLARGLDPKPEARWPSLDDLLDALVSAERQPRRRMRIYAALVAAGLLAAAVTLAMLLRPSTVPNACDAPDRAFAAAWSPAIREQLQRAANTPAFDKVAGQFDQYQERWIVSYQKACRTRNAKTFPKRVACLTAMADQINALTVMLQNAPPIAYERFDPALFPQLAQCERPSSIGPPALPEPGPTRTRVLALYPKLYGVILAAPASLEATSASLEREARDTGYLPLVGLTVVMTADAYLRHGEPMKAREAFGRVEKISTDANDTTLQARGRLGLLDAATAQLAEPEAKIGPKIGDPKAEPVLHPELDKLIAGAKGAIREDDALLSGGLEMNIADTYMQLGQWNRYGSAYAEAVKHAQEAGRQFDLLPDPRRSAQAAALEAEIYLARGDDRALDDATFVARRASDALEAAGLPVLSSLETIRRRVAFARREYTEVHRIADRQTAHEVSPVTTTLAGKVSPPGRARVIAWRGDLVGDPQRAYIEPLADAIDIVQSNPDGTFAIHAEPGWAIIGEQDDTRSLPQVIGKGPLELTLRPTVTQSGTVKGKNLLEVQALAHYVVGDSTWSLHVPVEREGMFDLRGMPQGGAPTFGTRGPAGHGERIVSATSVNALTWPTGQALEVIVHEDATVFVIAGALSPLPKTVAELDAVAARANDVTVATTRWIGASNTDAGREYYRPGDRHAVIVGNSGETTVCAATEKVVCRTISVAPSVQIEYRDGRHAAGVTPIVLDR